MSDGLPPLADLVAALDRGGVVLWVIAALSVGTTALILWKLWRLAVSGAWLRRPAEAAARAWAAGDVAAARGALGRDIRSRLAGDAMAALGDPALSEAAAREETLRRARALLSEARRGLRPLELVATVAPLLGLLGTVLGMIAAFQALQGSGARADPALLAGGIWEALLTTAAGMAVAIPAGVALVWFESVADRLQDDLEDLATRLFLRRPAPEPLAGSLAMPGAGPLAVPGPVAGAGTVPAASGGDPTAGQPSADGPGGRVGDARPAVAPGAAADAALRSPPDAVVAAPLAALPDRPGGGS